MKIAVMNATKVSIAPMEWAVKQFPEVQLFHFMDEGMSYLAKEEGRISGKNLARMVKLINSAEELGVDGILLSCTIFSPYIDLLKPYTDLPLVAADIGVFEKAASMYNEVGALVSFEPTLDSVALVVERCKRTVNKDFKAEIRLAEGAFAAAAAGNDDAHNRILFETAKELYPGKEAIVLSQMSHVRALPLFEDFPVPVLCSPPVSLGLLVDEIKRRG